jgi:hypothetical protein
MHCRRAQLVLFQSRLSRAFQSDTDKHSAFAAVPLEPSGLATVTYWPSSPLFDLMILSQTFIPKLKIAGLAHSKMSRAAKTVFREIPQRALCGSFRFA